MRNAERPPEERKFRSRRPASREEQEALIDVANTLEDLPEHSRRYVRRYLFFDGVRHFFKHKRNAAPAEDPHAGKGFADFSFPGVAPVLAVLLAVAALLGGCSSDVTAPEDVQEVTGMSVDHGLRPARPGESIHVAVSRTPGKIEFASGVCLSPSGEAVSEKTSWDGALNPFLFSCSFKEPGRAYVYFSARYYPSGVVASDSVAVTVVDTSSGR